MPDKNTKKNILFKISGSAELGFGHIKRSMALINVITESVPAVNIVIFCDCMEKSVINFFTPYKFFLNENDCRKIADYARKEAVDAVVIDEPSDNIELCRVFKKTMPGIPIFCLDYFNYRNLFVNTIINLFNQNIQAVNPSKEFTGKYYEGLEYAIIRDSFIPYIKKNKEINSKVERILITFGGSDTNNNTLRSLMLLDSIGYNRNVDVVIGQFFRNKKQVYAAIANKRYSARVYENINDIEKLVYRADLGFMGAGTTMMEFCAVGTPAIVMPQNEREARFAKLFEERGAIKLFNFNKTDVKLFSDVINGAVLRKTMSWAGRGLIDAKGKERIKGIILGAKQP